MEVAFKPAFLKDFKVLPLTTQEEVRSICTKVFPAAQSIKDIQGLYSESITGFKHYYRIRIGDYRVGFKKEGDLIIFMRVKHRKDIYRYFP